MLLGTVDIYLLYLGPVDVFSEYTYQEKRVISSLRIPSQWMYLNIRGP
jgi:hypothetical protein